MGDFEQFKAPHMGGWGVETPHMGGWGVEVHMAAVANFHLFLFQTVRESFIHTYACLSHPR